MKVKKQIAVSSDAWQAVLDLTKQANTNFDLGHVTCSDTVEAIILNTIISVDVLRAQCLDLRKALKTWSMKKDPDIDLLIDDLKKLKTKTLKKGAQTYTKKVKNERSS